MINLSAVDKDMIRHCLTPRQVYSIAETAAQRGTGRDVVASLVQAATDLAAMAAKLSEAYLDDSYDPDAARQHGLSPYRPSVLAAAATCAHNAALFLQEAQRRPAQRADGYDPLTARQPV
jgi:hypothetical protein